jgi:type VI secretion system protein VasD
MALRPYVSAVVALSLAIAALSACGGPPPPPPPTIVQLTLGASADANATASGAGAPVLVRVYQLASPAAFDKAEFFPLLNTDAAVLGPDLVKRDDYLMTPGTTKEVSITPSDRVQAIGVFAAFRQFQTQTWRVDLTPAPHKTTPAKVTIAAAGLAVAP